ncbi:hypothetical protein CH372_19080 [Leptospira meyeri]|uniref:hypothetical protein n=1 Tax=Leptospira meyeri TaxID=29508 RepID=UPI000C2A5AF9|nr:hypothetical protein [Leptospira meyeri]PKA10498.1 hypothetical protein CH372_19080 [Leptospira meyeri]
MTYDVTFIKINQKKIDADDFIEIVERLTLEESKIFNKSEKETIANLILNKIPDLEKKYEKDTIILESKIKNCFFDLAIYDSQISFSAPYWQSNDSSCIDEKFGIISNILVHNFKLTGYDSQTDRFIQEGSITLLKQYESGVEISKKIDGKNDSNHLILYGFIGIVFTFSVVIIYVLYKRTFL